MNLLVVGTLAYDSVETPFGKRESILGGSASFAATCASYFCPVQMVGIVGADFEEEHLGFFRARGIDTSGVERTNGKTFRWSGVYEENMNIRHTRETQLNVLVDFDPRLPPDYCHTPYVILGNIDPSLQLAVLEQLDEPRIVALDTMNFWIEDYREALERTLKRAHLLLINDEEARQLSGEDNLFKAARAVRSMGPETLVIKLGEHGAMLFDDSGVFNTAAMVLDSFVDPTGAGDSFAGGMLGYIAREGRTDAATMRRSMVLGTVMASFSVQDFSIDGVRNLTTDNVAARVHDYHDMTQIDLEGVGIA
jgi:sugar/nucleoside kinase (ribokinase family)